MGIRMMIRQTSFAALLFLATSMIAQEPAETRQLSSCFNFGNIVTQIESAIDSCCASITSKLPCSTVTPISQADIPFVITTPGKYCLTENIVSPDILAIAIVGTTDVELDLNGHTID